VNVCVICQGDGVLLTAGQWYCVDHVHEGFIATARMVARILGTDESEAEDKAWRWAEEL